MAARRDRSWQRSLVVDGVVLGAAAVVVAVTGAFAVVAGVDGAVLTREPQVTLDGPVYAGFLSNLGALVWMVGVTVAAIGWVTAVDPARRALFLAGTAIGAILLFDDFFLFHEWLDTLNSELDTVVLAGYLVLVVWLLVHHRRPLGAVGVTGIGGDPGPPGAVGRHRSAVQRPRPADRGRLQVPRHLPVVDDLGPAGPAPGRSVVEADVGHDPRGPVAAGSGRRWPRSRRPGSPWPR